MDYHPEKWMVTFLDSLLKQCLAIDPNEEDAGEDLASVGLTQDISNLYIPIPEGKLIQVSKWLPGSVKAIVCDSESSIEVEFSKAAADTIKKLADGEIDFEKAQVLKLQQSCFRLTDCFSPPRLFLCVRKFQYVGDVENVGQGRHRKLIEYIADRVSKYSKWREGWKHLNTNDQKSPGRPSILPRHASIPQSVSTRKNGSSNEPLVEAPNASSPKTLSNMESRADQTKHDELKSLLRKKHADKFEKTAEALPPRSLSTQQPIGFSTQMLPGKQTQDKSTPEQPEPLSHPTPISPVSPNVQKFISNQVSHIPAEGPLQTGQKAGSEIQVPVSSSTEGNVVQQSLSSGTGSKAPDSQGIEVPPDQDCTRAGIPVSPVEIRGAEIAQAKVTQNDWEGLRRSIRKHGSLSRRSVQVPNRQEKMYGDRSYYPSLPGKSKPKTNVPTSLLTAIASFKDRSQSPPTAKMELDERSQASDIDAPTEDEERKDVELPSNNSEKLATSLADVTIPQTFEEQSEDDEEVSSSEWPASPTQDRPLPPDSSPAETKNEEETIQSQPPSPGCPTSHPQAADNQAPFTDVLTQAIVEHNAPKHNCRSWGESPRASYEGGEARTQEEPPEAPSSNIEGNLSQHLGKTGPASKESSQYSPTSEMATTPPAYSLPDDLSEGLSPQKSEDGLPEVLAHPANDTQTLSDQDLELSQRAKTRQSSPEIPSSKDSQVILVQRTPPSKIQSSPILQTQRSPLGFKSSPHGPSSSLPLHRKRPLPPSPSKGNSQYPTKSRRLSFQPEPPPDSKHPGDRSLEVRETYFAKQYRPDPQHDEANSTFQSLQRKPGFMKSFQTGNGEIRVPDEPPTKQSIGQAQKARSLVPSPLRPEVEALARQAQPAPQPELTSPPSPDQPAHSRQPNPRSTPTQRPIGQEPASASSQKLRDLIKNIRQYHPSKTLTQTHTTQRESLPPQTPTKGDSWYQDDNTPFKIWAADCAAVPAMKRETKKLEEKGGRKVDLENWGKEWSVRHEM
ncbi:MAG: hypothetical protein Q9227_004875 [Pyrenula ochraceoflavens]